MSEEPKPEQLPIRRMARERALQVLYRLDLSPSDGPADESIGDTHALADEDLSALRPREVRKIHRLADELMAGIKAHHTEIDQQLSKHAQHWTLDRMLAIDRNILRIAVYELAYDDNVPPAVSINEAVEIAKDFGGEDSSRFVNGVLDRIHRELSGADEQTQ